MVMFLVWKINFSASDNEPTFLIKNNNLLQKQKVRFTHSIFRKPAIKIKMAGTGNIVSNHINKN